MRAEENKYDKILGLLRKSKPLLTETEDIEEKVLALIQKPGRKEQDGMNIFDYLFRWVYIGWIRYTLVAVSVFLAGLFIYQQSLILRRINMLENQTTVTGSQFVRWTTAGPDNNNTLNRLNIFRMNSKRIGISEKQFEELLDSYNELEGKYKNLINVINEDPDLKQILEKKLSEKDRKKLKL